MKEVEVKARVSDAEFAKHEGEWFTTKDMQIFDEDVDVYAISHPDDVKAGKPERKLLAKLRKSAIPKETVQIGWDAFRLLAIPSRNRGAAAGPIDTKGIYWSSRKPVKIDKWSAQYMTPDSNGKQVESKMRVNNVVSSGVIGYYEKTPFLGQPCRMTGYTRSGLKQFLHGLPFLEAIDTQFKKLVPAAHKKQLAEVSKKPMFQIGETAFSTLTVNSNFRTALHKDAGDYTEGFGNLTVIEWGKYHGGETLFPRFGVGFNIRTGDFVAMDVHEWHTNAPITTTAEDIKYNKSLPDIRTRDQATGVIGSQELYQRVSFVCYFREKIAKCVEKETRDYYKKIDFDLKGATTKAKSAHIKTLVLPGLTGSVEEAHAQRAKAPRHTMRRRAQTEKLRRRKHFE
jgi:hypothetical protein